MKGKFGALVVAEVQTRANSFPLASWLTCIGTEQILTEDSPVNEQKRWFCDVTIVFLLLKFSTTSGL